MITASEAKEISLSSESAKKNVDYFLQTLEPLINLAASRGEISLSFPIESFSHPVRDCLFSSLKSLGYIIIEAGPKDMTISWKDTPVYEDHRQLVEDYNSENDALDDYDPVDEGDR